MELFWFWFRVGEIGGIFHRLTRCGESTVGTFHGGRPDSDGVLSRRFLVVAAIGPWMPEHAARQ